MPHTKHNEFWNNIKPVQATIKSSYKRFVDCSTNIIKCHKLKHTAIMNKEQTKALMLYCDITFGYRDISIAKCIDCLDTDAKAAGMSRLQYLDYVVANGRLP